MNDLGIGIIGGGYMGKAHAVAFSCVSALFDTALKPRLEMVCASSATSAERYRVAYGFARATSDWRVMVDDPKIDAIIIASPQETHREIAVAALAAGKHVMCEKPLGGSLDDSRAMLAAAEASGGIHMVGFNYIRTPASQYAYALIQSGRLGDITYFRGEHTEDFYADPDAPATWRTTGMANGTMGDLAPHMINGARRLMGPIKAVNAVVETVHHQRGGVPVTNDDQAQIMVKFESGVTGHIHVSRIATGRKMGYAYEVHGTKGAIRFDGEDQNALHLYLREGPEAEQGFRKILAGPAHPDYLPFCQGPGHGTGYQDQITIEAAHFLAAISENTPQWPTFAEGMEVNRVVAAALDSSAKGVWVDVADY
ncbi:Gfo/Idh/MocA family oxidoreductase [uncultured Litoreibacter sp.]|uniref:Gfo/Idh/MocA family protein n=1 Tax=uncultured Litoreibacter sp. TaxID=1392394 RepID=UPI00260E0816|nr:Gfo/Idh/MocA family oxidoreductase [uncultured Litoreibacter sp.]